MLKKIVLFGAGGFAREVANMIEIINLINPTYNLLGFVVDSDFYKDGVTINGYPILGDESWFKDHCDVFCTVAIANVNIRKRVQESLKKKGVRFETLIAPYVYIPESTKIGEGTIIFGHSLISVNVTMSEGVFINSGVSIGHDVHIGSYTTVMPGTGISGGVSVGSKVLIGGHAFIVPGKCVGDNAVVAAGSIVFSNVKAGTTVLGNPARRMRALEDNY